MTESWPLTSFEHFMLADDRPGHPMTFWLRLTVDGLVDGAGLVTAVRRAVARHPLLHARLCGDPAAPTANLRWEVDPELVPQVFVAPEGIPLECGLPGGPGRGIDVRHEAGVRLFVRQHAKGSTWLLQVHHAVSDGVGAIRFVEDVFAFYGAGADVTPPELRSLVPEQLARRGAFHLAAGQRRRRVAADVGRAWLFFRQRPAPLATPHVPSVTGLPPWPSCLVREVDEAQLEALKARGYATRATVNDLLLRDLFQALDGWNQAAGSPRRHVRLAMAVNMRTTLDDHLPAANVVSMCFLDRRGAAFDDPEALLKGIVRETDYIKRFSMGHALILVAALAGRVRGGLAWMLTPRLAWKCLATAVLSNLGVPLRRQLCGGTLRVTRLELLPPIRPFTALAVGCVTYLGRLTLTFHYDGTLLTERDAATLFDAFMDRVQISACAGPASEERSALLQRLVKEHTSKREGAAAFWSLPIGKHVVPGAEWGRSSPATAQPLQLGDEHADEISAGRHGLEGEASLRQ